MTKSENSQSKEEFLFPIPNVTKEDVTFLDIAKINNLSNFSHHVSYLMNMSVSGKMEPDSAFKEIKKLYKAMKKSHNSLNGGWF
jgi:hypothetical protein